MAGEAGMLWAILDSPLRVDALLAMSAPVEKDHAFSRAFILVFLDFQVHIGQ